MSAHASVGLDGTKDIYVDSANSAWANGILESGNNWQRFGLPSVDPNWLTVSIETEDDGSGSTAVTDAQYASVLELVLAYKLAYPSIIYLVGHNDISPLSRPNCPGPRWRSGRFQQLAAASRLGVLS